MRFPTKSLVVFLLLIPLLSGCGIAYSVLLGVDSTPDWKLDKNIIKRSKKYDISPEYRLVMDTGGYYKGLGEVYGSLFKEIKVSEDDSSAYFALNKILKDDAQPVHYRLFDSSGKEIFKIVNCYVDPPIPMNWNVGGCFDTFPPKTSIQNLNKHNFDLDFILENSSFIDGRKLSLDELPVADYYGVVIWNDFFRRPSRKLIKTVRKSIEKSEGRVELIYIHNQNAYLWQVMDSETHSIVKTKLEELKSKE